MTKLKSIAIVVFIVASGAYVINNISDSKSAATESEKINTKVPLAEPKKQASLDKHIPPPRQETRVNHAALPVEHGYADESGKQINPETGKRLPPPPPVSAPNQERSIDNHAAHQHGHETINSSKKRGSDVPPPVGPRS